MGKPYSGKTHSPKLSFGSIKKYIVFIFLSTLSRRCKKRIIYFPGHFKTCWPFCCELLKNYQSMSWNSNTWQETLLEGQCEGIIQCVNLQEKYFRADKKKTWKQKQLLFLQQAFLANSNNVLTKEKPQLTKRESFRLNHNVEQI